MIGIPYIGKAHLRNVTLCSRPHAGHNLDMPPHGFRYQMAFWSKRINGIHHKVISRCIQQFRYVLIFQEYGKHFQFQSRINVPET
jgi:hypothetical protein